MAMEDQRGDHGNARVSYCSILEEDLVVAG
jgi:hypothetical protein